MTNTPASPQTGKKPPAASIDQALKAYLTMLYPQGLPEGANAEQVIEMLRQLVSKDRPEWAARDAVHTPAAATPTGNTTKQTQEESYTELKARIIAEAQKEAIPTDPEERYLYERSQEAHANAETAKRLTKEEQQKTVGIQAALQRKRQDPFQLPTSPGLQMAHTAKVRWQPSQTFQHLAHHLGQQQTNQLLHQAVQLIHNAFGAETLVTASLPTALQLASPRHRSQHKTAPAALQATPNAKTTPRKSQQWVGKAAKHSHQALPLAATKAHGRPADEKMAVAFSSAKASTPRQSVKPDKEMMLGISSSPKTTSRRQQGLQTEERRSLPLRATLPMRDFL